MTSRYASILALALLTSFAADRASAYCRMTTRSAPQVGNTECTTEGAPLFWRSPCLSYAIDGRGSQWMTNEDIEEAVDLAFETWENVDCGGSPPNLIFHALEPSTCARPEFNDTGNVNTIAFLEPWRNPCAEADEPDYDPFALAVTTVWRDGDTGEIFDADMMINEQMTTSLNAGGPYDNCPNTGCPPGSPGVPGPTDLQSIVTHEIGHFVGIGHSDVEGATMYWKTEQTSVSNRVLAQDDIDAVCDIYPPGGLNQSCDSTPFYGLRLDCETDDAGGPLACSGPASVPGGGGGCSATRTQTDAPWMAMSLALLGIAAVRRRVRISSAGRGAVRQRRKNKRPVRAFRHAT